jgi:hypothetical protein
MTSQVASVLIQDVMVSHILTGRGEVDTQSQSITQLCALAWLDKHMGSAPKDTDVVQLGQLACEGFKWGHSIVSLVDDIGHSHSLTPPLLVKSGGVE